MAGIRFGATARRAARTKRISRRSSFTSLLIRASCISKLLSFVGICRVGGQLLSCDDEYEFGACEGFDRNRLLVLDYQSLAGMHLNSADLNFACCRYQISRVSFAEGIACLAAIPKHGPVHFGVGANRQRPSRVAPAGKG